MSFSYLEAYFCSPNLHCQPLITSYILPLLNFNPIYRTFSSNQLIKSYQQVPTSREYQVKFSQLQRVLIWSKTGGAASRLERGAVSVMNRVILFHSTAQWRAHFEASKSSNKLMVIDFSASWCGPCRYMEPFVNEMAAKYSEVEFIKIDVDELPAVSRDFSIQAMPTFVLLRGGKEVGKVVGANKDELQWKIEKHRAVY